MPKPRMPRMFDWIKIYLDSSGFDGKGGPAVDESWLIASLTYYTERAASFKDSPIPDWWDQNKVDATLGHGL